MNPKSITRLLIISHLIALLSFTSFLPSARGQEFSRDSAYAVLTVLAGDIGPRPMGSPAEKKALDYAVAKFAAYGCQEAYVMPFQRAATTNTNSGVAIGVLKGSTGRIIVIGGHIDSAGPQIPGADDDGSGAACVLEIARVMGHRRFQSTIVFCCFGGEEEGMRGSEYFVRTFPAIDSVALMLQIDMADGSSWLEIDPDAPLQKSAPQWLTGAAYEVYFDRLGYSNMVYPTHVSTLNYSMPEGSGSDHIPFLQHGIPAIDFTSDINYPIHTPQDNLALFDPSGLARSGNLVLKLAERFDAGVPPRGTEKYYLFQVGKTPIFIPHWILALFIGVAGVAAFLGFISLRRRKSPVRETTRVRWSGAKIIFIVFVIQAFVWVSDHLVGLFNCTRFPWVNNFPGFVALGALSGLVGLWLMLQLIRRFRLTTQPLGMYLRACMILVVFTLLLLIVTVELAIYPAFGLLCIGLAAVSHRPGLSLGLVLVSPVMLLRLPFSEGLGLMQRLLAQNPVNALLTDGFFTLSFTLLSLPFAYAFAAVYRDAGKDIFWLRRLRTKWGLSVLLILLTGATVFLAGRQVYDRSWFANVHVEQRYAVRADSSSLLIRSAEYLDRLSVRGNGVDTLLSGRLREFVYNKGHVPPVPWATIAAHSTTVLDSARTDSTIVCDRSLKVTSLFRPLSVRVTYWSTDPMIVQSPWASGGGGSRTRDSERVKTFYWYSFPDTMLEVPVHLGLRKGQIVKESIEVVYDSLAFPLNVGRQFTNVSKRTIVAKEDTIHAEL